MKRDELNVLADEYYSVMDIPEEKKKKRKEDAWELFDLFMLFFLWFEEAEEKGVSDTAYFLPRFQNELQDVISSITTVDDYLISYIAILALGIYTTTQAHKDEKYYLSEDRAVNLALNESLSINNHLDLKQAKTDGYRYKVWQTELDNKVRPTHMEMEGVKIPIDDLFVVGDSLMEVPHDITHGASASEISNCRCSCRFTKE